MAREVVVAGDLPYTVNFDDPRRRGDLFQSLVLAELSDELTGNPVAAPVEVTTNLAGARARTGRNGVAGLVGIPVRVFPRLDAQPYPFDVRFEVDGFLPLVRTPVTVVQQPTFPDTFADENLGLVELRRQPVSFTVRALEPDLPNPPRPVANATIEVSRLWRLVADLGNAPIAADIVALRPGLYAPRPQPATTFELVTLNPVAEPDRLLTSGAPAGSRAIAVSNVGALTATDVVGIDRADPDRAEHIIVDSIVGPSDPNSPATLVLAHPTQFAHRQNVLVRAVTPVSLGPPGVNLTDEGFAGDPTVFVSATAAFAGAPFVRINGGTADDEFVTVLPYSVVTGADGYGRLPPITRVAAIELVANAPGPISAPATAVTPNYLVSENHAHLTLA